MRILVIGLGTQGKKRVKVAGSDVVATVDPEVEGATYLEIDQAPLDSFDAALVCTPDPVKPELLAYLLQNKKHVLVEKPLLGGNDHRLQDLQRLAEAQQVVCYTAYNHRFEPHILRLKALLATGWLGRIYQVKFFYGNGTAREVRDSSWRDTAQGVLADLGSHLLDWTLFLFGQPLTPPIPWAAHCFENKAYDHYQFSFPGTPALDYEMTLLSWRNTFRLDLFAENGSVHLDGLCKWGPSIFTSRRRVMPSGRPVEETETLECPDPTWRAEYDHFLGLCQNPMNNIENDIWIEAVLRQLRHESTLS